MAVAADEMAEPTRVDQPASNAISDSSSSDSDDSDDATRTASGTPVEWLATGRSKRATAGNRMKSMLAQEEPDDDLELLFAEDGSDGGFSEVDDAGSDVQMDSSSDSEDENKAAGEDDELAGEKELERQARENRAAQRKRKANEAIPARFRKKVRIDDRRQRRPSSAAPSASSDPASATAKPAPRPKKKSERASWLPSQADMPTRASARQTTVTSKEQLHQQMVAREAKRLKQVEAMEKKAKKLEALKKPPMTQAERLAEAEKVEKRNSKSLNRWEEAEKAREEERKAKLAALNNRTLKGPVVTFWSGVGIWDGDAKGGMTVSIEEKPVRKKREKKDKGEKAKQREKEKEKEKEKENENEVEKEKKEANQVERHEQASEAQVPSEKVAGDDSGMPPAPASNAPEASGKPTDEHKPDPSALTVPTSQSKDPDEAVLTIKTESTSAVLAPPATSEAGPSLPLPASRPDEQPRPMVISSTSSQPPPSLTTAQPPSAPSSGLKAPVLAPPVLAPPPGGIHLGGPNMSPKSNVLAPPNTSQRTSPLSFPPSTTSQAHQPAPAAQPTPTSPPPTNSSAHSHPTQPKGPAVSQPPSAAPATEDPSYQAPTVPPTSSEPCEAREPGASLDQENQPAVPNAVSGGNRTDDVAGPATDEKASINKTTRHAIILQNFDENRINDKTAQTQVLFGRRRLARMSKKPAPPPTCTITGQPARYRDPRTGLAYANAYAYREIQRLVRGDHRFSALLGAWVGSAGFAAQGVPERFLNAGAGKGKKEAAQGHGKENCAPRKNTEPIDNGPERDDRVKGDFKGEGPNEPASEPKTEGQPGAVTGKKASTASPDVKDDTPEGNKMEGVRSDAPVQTQSQTQGPATGSPVPALAPVPAPVPTPSEFAGPARPAPEQSAPVQAQAPTPTPGPVPAST